MAIFLILSILISPIGLCITIECEKPCKLTSDSVSCKWNSSWNNSNIIAKAKYCLEDSNRNKLGLVLSKKVDITKSLLQPLTSVTKLSFDKGNDIRKLHPEAFRKLYNLRELNLQNTGVKYKDILNALPAVRYRLVYIKAGQRGTKCNCDWFLLAQKLDELRINYQDTNNPTCDEYDEAQNKQICLSFSQTTTDIYQREVVRVNRAALCSAVIIILFTGALMFVALLRALSKPFNFENDYLIEEESIVNENLNDPIPEKSSNDIQSSITSCSFSINSLDNCISGQKDYNHGRSLGHLTINTPGLGGPRIRVISKDVKIETPSKKTAIPSLNLNQLSYSTKHTRELNEFVTKPTQSTRITTELNSDQPIIDLSSKNVKKNRNMKMNKGRNNQFH